MLELTEGLWGHTPVIIFFFLPPGKGAAKAQTVSSGSNPQKQARAASPDPPAATEGNSILCLRLFAAGHACFIHAKKSKNLLLLTARRHRGEMEAGVDRRLQLLQRRSGHAGPGRVHLLQQEKNQCLQCLCCVALDPL